ncbi:carbonate dehydratase [Agrilactobacillus composti DSM 18527 = JCM 14202]|uniref:carbonic anhydrase n=1 Tax=Agrilactobacillus composti DSM 18527 = JCM 14202 TaxID=1423734 RepID=X0PE65_9LACO|nr:carbonic anhydrase family protein [Agrilactobacillus composti]KRM31049.1 carbonate dehydratase [Agrilactobacillus composti DSM 18527 = JCM 14202]GAF39573.1 carbonic anhydrase [Agrilactobacillus composti DSM 18527 = JCM 14202]
MYSYRDQAQWQITSGQMQSPIDIPTQQAIPLADLPQFHTYTITGIQNLGFKLSLTGVGSATLLDRAAAFKELHFHHPAEHLLNGQRYALEAHFVHEFIDGQNAVVSVLFELGLPNPQLAALLDQVDTSALTQPVDVSSWLKAPSFYHYVGSLTTPPVQEGIEWYVAAKPLMVAQSQLDRLATFFGANNRQIQPLNQRKILRLH